MRALAGRTVDATSVIAGALTPDTISERVAKAYRRHLFGDATLQDLPDHPRFVINATSVQSGVLFRFSKPYMADWRVGRVNRPDRRARRRRGGLVGVPARPLPLRARPARRDWIDEEGNDLGHGEYRERAVLSDGGVYDNLGLETAWKACRTVLVSDAGGQMAAEPDPDHDWGRHLFRVLGVIDNQVRSLRKRQSRRRVQRQASARAPTGASARDIADFDLADALPAPHAATMALATLSTRLARLDDVVQERLINWGYAACDAGMRAHVDPALPAPGRLPLSRGRDRRRVSEHDELLRRFLPRLRYDSNEQYFADSAAQWTDNPGNELRARRRRRCWPARPSSRSLTSATVRDAAGVRLHLRPAPRLPRPVRGAAGRPARAHATAPTGTRSSRTAGSGSSTGSGTSTTTTRSRSTPACTRATGRWCSCGCTATSPTSRSTPSTSTPRSAPWTDVEHDDGHPVVYVARGSDASYFEAGFHTTEAWYDIADGKRKTPELTLEILDGDGPGWARWPGRWGDTQPRLPGGLQQPSPTGPGAKAQWSEARHAARQGDHAAARTRRAEAPDVTIARNGDWMRIDVRLRAPRPAAARADRDGQLTRRGRRAAAHLHVLARGHRQRHAQHAHPDRPGQALRRLHEHERGRPAGAVGVDADAARPRRRGQAKSRPAGRRAGARQRLRVDPRPPQARRTLSTSPAASVISSTRSPSRSRPPVLQRPLALGRLRHVDRPRRALGVGAVRAQVERRAPARGRERVARRAGRPARRRVLLVGVDPAARDVRSISRGPASFLRGPGQRRVHPGHLARR